MRFIYILLLLFSTSAYADVISDTLNSQPPPQAVASGFKRLVYQETFQTFIPQSDGYTFQGDNLNIWTNGMGFFGANPGPIPALVQGLRLPGNALLTTQSRGWPTGTDAASRSFLHGYFEIIWRVSGLTPPGKNWCSAWLFSSAHQQVTQSPPTEWGEIDIDETGWYPLMGSTTHDWQAISTAPYQQERVPQSPAFSAWKNYPGDVTQWHKSGLDWESGKVSFYYNDVLVTSVSTTDRPIIDTDKMSLVMSTNNQNGASQCDVLAWRVFQ